MTINNGKTNYFITRTTMLLQHSVRGVRAWLSLFWLWKIQFLFWMSFNKVFVFLEENELKLKNTTVLAKTWPPLWTLGSLHQRFSVLLLYFSFLFKQLVRHFHFLLHILPCLSIYVFERNLPHLSHSCRCSATSLK